MRIGRLTIAGIALLALASGSFASETITYAYDALGRLVQVARSGTVNDGVNASYSYDPADNRTNVTVSGAPTPPSFSVNDVSVTEGGALVFTVTKTGAASISYSVDYATANGTATAGADYTAKSGTLTFTSAQTTQTVSVTTIDDAVVESAETVLLNLSNPSGGATISDSQGVGTIIDNDAVNLPPVTQPDNGGTIAVCTFTSVNVVANDTDPEGNYPLSLVGIQSVSPGGYGSATVQSSTHVGFSAGSVGGGVQITYIVQDSLGATSTGILGIIIEGDGCW